MTITFFPARFRSTINYNFTDDETILITLFKLFQLIEVIESNCINTQKYLVQELIYIIQNDLN